MGKQTEELKQVAQLRKALTPLLDVMRAETNADITKRLETIENAIADMAKRDVQVTVSAPDVKVEIPKAVTETLNRLKKSDDTANATNYEPHDQSAGAIKYNGFVASNGCWYIQRLTKGQQRYAMGKGGYDEAWNDRKKLKYGNFDGS